MIIRYGGDEKFEVKSSETRLNLTAEGIEIEGFTIKTAGEFERRGVFVQGIPSALGQKTVYTINTEEMTLCYLNGLKNDLDEEALGLIGDIDILFVPLGENDSLSIKQAQKLISDIDPRVVIPMLYSDIEQFKTAEGITDGEVDQLKIKKADLPVEERKFYILNSKG